MSEIEKWKNRSPEEADEAFHFLKRLKAKNLNNKVDRLGKQLTGEAYDKIDCLECANCCRSTVTDFDMEDISRASKHLGISKKQFISKYLVEDPFDKTYITNTTPCPFLDIETNKCDIYEVRPKVCNSFPHTHKDMFLTRRYAHTSNMDFCPITYYVIKRMQEEYDRI